MIKRIFPSQEYALLAHLEKILGPVAATGAPYEVTLGDDAAVRRCRGSERMVFTTDVAVENVHFTIDTMSFEEIGFRAMAANCSDCAAMAALPEAALVQLVFPRAVRNLRNKVGDLYRGFAAACRRFRFRLVGGDLAAGAVWTIGITMIGVAPAPGRLLRRTGIVAGDTIWVSGFPGCSAAGLAVLEKWGRKNAPEKYRRLVESHVRPLPRLALGVLLGRCRAVHALMDCSDGLSKDCRTLCFENRLGLDIVLDDLMAPDDMVALGRALNTPWQEWALHGGEDYQLLFTASKRFDPSAVALKERRGLMRLGVFTDKHAGLRIRHNGKTRLVSRRGWDHVAESLRNKG